MADLKVLADDMTAWRRDFHRHPELAFEEHRTSARVAELLESFGLEVHRGLGGTGVVGVLKRGRSERCIGLRADMDALPIDERTGVDWSSETPGVMHACGHDGHTAMLLGAARHLSSSGTFDGTIVFVFQPAEEKGGGARVMIEDGLFDQFPVERIFGLHNIPNAPVGRFALCKGPMMAAIDTFTMAVVSAGGHAAFPHGAVDTVVIATEVVSAMQSIVSRNLDPLDHAVLSITQIHGGHADNVIPARVELGGCVRTFRTEVQNKIERRMEEILAGVSGAHGASHEFDYQRYYPATVNTAAEVEMAANAAREVGESVDAEMTPVMGSEDFSYMLQKKPGAFIFLGGGKGSGLHTDQYDFNDEILVMGARYWCTLAETLLSA